MTRLSLPALAALAILAPLTARADPPATLNNNGTYVHAGFSESGSPGMSAAHVHERNGQYSAFAAADLYDGRLHAAVESFDNPELPAYCTVLTCSWGTSAYADLWDTIVVNPGDKEPGATIPWEFSMDGIKTRGRWAWGDGAAAEAYYYVGTDPNGWYHPHQLTLGAQNSVGGSFTMPDSGQLKVYFFASLWVSATSGSVADYSNTMAFHWTLPEGATYTSSSGQFMMAPVPEPSTTGMLLAGGGLVAWVARQRRGVNR